MENAPSSQFGFKIVFVCNFATSHLVFGLFFPLVFEKNKRVDQSINQSTNYSLIHSFINQLHTAQNIEKKDKKNPSLLYSSFDVIKRKQNLRASFETLLRAWPGLLPKSPHTHTQSYKVSRPGTPRYAKSFARRSFKLRDVCGPRILPLFRVRVKNEMLYLHVVCLCVWLLLPLRGENTRIADGFKGPLFLPGPQGGEGVCVC